MHFRDAIAAIDLSRLCVHVTMLIRGCVCGCVAWLQVYRDMAAFMHQFAGTVATLEAGSGANTASVLRRMRCHASMQAWERRVHAALPVVFQVHTPQLSPSLSRSLPRALVVRTAVSRRRTGGSRVSMQGHPPYQGSSHGRHGKLGRTVTV